MPRVDSEGVMCGANFSVDSQSRKSMMPRVGSEANWAPWGGSQAWFIQPWPNKHIEQKKNLLYKGTFFFSIFNDVSNIT